MDVSRYFSGKVRQVKFKIAIENIQNTKYFKPKNKVLINLYLF